MSSLKKHDFKLLFNDNKLMCQRQQPKEQSLKSWTNVLFLLLLLIISVTLTCLVINLFIKMDHMEQHLDDQTTPGEYL